MCGIAGILAPGSAEAQRVHRMAGVLRHRGPDDEGYVAVTAGAGAVALAGPETAAACLPEGAPRLPDDGASEGADLVLGVRRLAIIDLSPTGHQPMSSPDGQAWIAHNGEIYNYRELRDELQVRGHAFRGGSDTEVALAAYREWGPACFERFNGMWATAIWDDTRRTLLLSRDRFGVKPLYLARLEGALVFASEIKSLLAAGVPARPREEALSRFLETGRIDVGGAGTCFAGIEQIEPGTYLECTLDAASRPHRYYDLEARLAADGEAPGDLLELLDDAVRLRLRSDVPVGSCLSGGLDSSTLVSLAQAQLEPAGERMHTFTFAAGSPPHDETRFARQVADVVGAEAAFAGLPVDLTAQLEATALDQEEPIGSGSVVAQRLVMALAHACGAKVLLDGQGGDEVLAGYPYYAAARLADVAVSRPHRYPRQLGRAGANGLGKTGWLLRATLGELRRRRPGLERLRGRQLDDVHHHLPALLHYEDRNSMAFSIETRLPFLDYRVVEHGLRLSGAEKLHDGWTKASLRRGLAGRLPDDIVWRTDKVQFSVPQERWLRGPLRELASDLLLTPTFAARSVSDPEGARSLLGRVDTLDRAGADRLWRLLALELWYRTFADAPVRAAVRPLSRVP